MGRNKRYKRKAKRLIGHCINKKCRDCEHFKMYVSYDTYYECYEEEYCCDLKFGCDYEGEGYRWIENYFKGKSDKPFDIIKDN